jgi:hypothetical protein
MPSTDRRHGIPRISSNLCVVASLYKYQPSTLPTQFRLRPRYGSPAGDTIKAGAFSSEPNILPSRTYLPLNIHFLTPSPSPSIVIPLHRHPPPSLSPSIVIPIYRHPPSPLPATRRYVYIPNHSNLPTLIPLNTLLANPPLTQPYPPLPLLLCASLLGRYVTTSASPHIHSSIPPSIPPSIHTFTQGIRTRGGGE